MDIVPPKDEDALRPVTTKTGSIEDGTAITTHVTDLNFDEGHAAGAYSKRSIFFMVLFSGLAIGSDAYNSALMGQLLLLFTALYPDTLSVATQSRLTNAFIIGLILGMLAFGFISDRLGRKAGAVLTTLFLSLGIIMTAVSHGTSDEGLFWMLTVSRGVAGFGAGGEYPVSGAGTAESTDDSPRARKHRGFIFAMVADVSSSLGFVFSGLVPLLLLLCFHEREAHYEKVWRIAFALGVIVRAPTLSLMFVLLTLFSLPSPSSGSAGEWPCRLLNGAARRATPSSHTTWRSNDTGDHFSALREHGSSTTTSRIRSVYSPQQSSRP
jgi:MFS family permease